VHCPFASLFLSLFIFQTRETKKDWHFILQKIWKQKADLRYPILWHPFCVDKSHRLVSAYNRFLYNLQFDFSILTAGHVIRLFTIAFFLDHRMLLERGLVLTSSLFSGELCGRRPGVVA
jgi:hypothetical protein